MKRILLVFISIFISACATQEFNSTLNCSTRALEHLEKATDKLSRTSPPALVKAGKDAMLSVSTGVQKCYEANQEKLQGNEFNLCAVVSTDSKGAITFSDIDDFTKTISPEFRTCLESAIEKTDFQKIPSSTLLQPIRLRVRIIAR